MAALDPEQPGITPLLAHTQEELASVKVFPLIPALKKDVTGAIANTALSWEQLNASDINFTIVRPLVTKYARLRNIAVVYACLVVRSYFLAQADLNLAFTAIMQSRASLCELLAVKLISRFASNYMQLVAVLTTSWCPLAGASSATVEEVKYAISGHDLETSHTALEMAICTSSKAFLATPVVQKLVNDIYSGNVVFSLPSTRSILADNYNPCPIQMYDVNKAPFLNHYRLRVPRYGAIFEYLNFAILLITFILCVANQDRSQLTFLELVFMVIAMAHVLEEYTAATEHGWYIYIANMWNAFDFSFIVIFLVYFGLRIKGLHNNDLATSRIAFDILACGGCILFPRLVFFAVANHVIILSLQAMIVQFVVFIGTVIICFSGLMFTLWILARDRSIDHNHEPWTLGSLAWYCVHIWLGSGYVIFSQADSFHPILGPLLVTVFALFSSTLLVTILISILSNTVSKIGSNAPQEYLFQFAISTIEGVKNEALFSYQPPFNILAFVILKPASWFLSPKALHNVNIFLIISTSLPQLLFIAIYERRLKSGSKDRQANKDISTSIFKSLPRHIKNMHMLEALLGPAHHDIYDAILDMEMDDEYDIFSELEEDEEEGQLFSSRVHTRQSTARSDFNQIQITGVEAQLPSVMSSGRRRTHTSSTTWGTLRPPWPRRRMATANNPDGFVADQRLAFGGYGTVASTLAEEGASFPSRLTAGFNGGNENLGVARLYGSRNGVTFSGAEQTVLAANAQTNTSVKKVEALLTEVKSLPVNKLKDEMKEIQERQNRIESLLLMLTRGMRNDGLRHETY